MPPSLAYFQSPSVVQRSVFTNRGPIVKPPLTLQSGVGVALTPSQATLTGALLTQAHVGLVIRLTGSGNNNDGEFLIETVLSPTKAKLRANFHTPEPNPLSWSLVNLRRGEIADTPSDVTVKVNGIPVGVEEVSGLLGQVVLLSAPLPADTVRVSYRWLAHPHVELRGLNRRAFTLNRGRPPRRSLGSYRTYNYKAVLTNPKNYQASSLLAKQAQPRQRQLGYRAYERAYSVALNDPNLLVLNTPRNRIAYPPLQRTLSESFIRYEALTLPENDPDNPWERIGTGVTSIAFGSLLVMDTTTGDFPVGQPLFWRRQLDLSFPHVMALSWRGYVADAPSLEGVWTGVSAGWSDGSRLTLIGFLDDGGVKKMGFLLGGSATEGQGGIASWRTADLDWTTLRSYRLFQAKDGSVSFYLDGDVLPTLTLLASERPYLYELNDPLNTLQGVVFGSLSRPAQSTSSWDFVKHLVLPTNPYQTAPSAFVSYEGNTLPEDAPLPWTPVGYHGTGTVLGNNLLLLDSTSASTASGVGLVGGDFRAYARIEPLASASTDLVFDVGVSLRTWTHGVTPHGVFAAYSDGSRLIQLTMLSSEAYPTMSYPGRSLPEEAQPSPWVRLGGTIDPSQLKVELRGRTLLVTDTTINDGVVFVLDDPGAPTTSARVFSPAVDAYVEARLRVEAYTVDSDGFAGVTVDAFDGEPLTPGRSYGLLLVEVGAMRYVALHSQGVFPVVATFAFDWFDGAFHTYRLAKSTAGDLISLFVDGVFLGSAAYSLFSASLGNGALSFGSSTAVSVAALSTVEWAYVNAWRAPSSLAKKYVGVWKDRGHAEDLTGYHLPLKASGKATLSGNTLTDPGANFFGAGVIAGDAFVLDAPEGLRGVYEITAVPTPTTLTLSLAVLLEDIQYRVPSEQDWTIQHKYRLFRSADHVSLFLDSQPVPLLQARYPEELPPVLGSPVDLILGGLPGFVWGAMSPVNLSQSAWDYVRYGVTRALSETRIVPHHMVLNQRNVMQSPEHLFTSLPHTHTQFSSSSTGIVPTTTPDFLASPTLQAYTVLFEGTPLVPSTQSKNVRGSQVITQFVSVLNSPEDVLNSDPDFTLNDATKKVIVKVAEDVLYNCLKVVEKTSGELDLLSPACDTFSAISGINYTKEVCLVYDGSVLPENDTSAQTPWVLASDVPAQVSTSAFSGVLTYSTGGVGTKTIYKNDTPFPDAPSLRTEINFKLKVLNDSTAGTGDTQIRFGLSAPGFTVAFALVTTPLGERLVLLKDVNNGNLLSSVPFDYLGGAFHTYRVVRDPGAGLVSMFIDS